MAFIPDEAGTTEGHQIQVVKLKYRDDFNSFNCQFNEGFYTYLPSEVTQTSNK